jgi:DNA-binding PadR family transcriptional regulator
MTTPHLRRVQSLTVTPAEFHILLALSDVDRHGYAIMQQVAEDSGGAVRLGPGTLYTAIKRLLDYGFIREVETRVDRALDDARRKYYRVTAAGRTAATAEAERMSALVRLARGRQLMTNVAKAKGGRA